MPTTTFANLPDGFNLMALFDQAYWQCLALYPPNTFSGAGPFTIGGNLYGDVLINSSSPVTVNLPASASRTPNFTGAGPQPVRIVDISGNASTNNITIVPVGAEKIVGLSSVVINVNWGSFYLFPLPTGGWYRG